MSDSGIYEKVSVEAAVTGWILSRKGHPAEIFTRWEALISRMQYLLTNKGDRE